MFSFNEIMSIICLSITVTLFLLTVERIIKNVRRVKELNNIISEFDEYIEEHAIIVLDDTFKNNEIIANIRTIQ